MQGKIPKKVETRIRAELKRFKPIIENAKSRDINESDTVILITDFLDAVLGWDKYSEITTEYAIRSTYCDLAVMTGDSVHFLIEAKAVGLSLNDKHLRQAVNYAANQGIDWVILTNAWQWQAHRVLFKKPIESELVFELDLTDINPKTTDAIHPLYLLSKEGVGKAAIDAYHEKAKVLNRFTIAALTQTEPVAKVIIRELRRMNKTISLTVDDLGDMLRNEILKRDVVNGDQAERAEKLVKKAVNKAQRQKAKKAKRPAEPPAPPVAQEEPPVSPAPSFGGHDGGIDPGEI